VGGFHRLNFHCLTSPVQEKFFPIVLKASSKRRWYEKTITLQFVACQSIISLALINFKFKFAYSLSTPVLCPNRRYLDEIGIGRGDWYFVDYKGFSFH